MGFFDFIGDVVHTIESPIQHLIGKTATNVLFPVFPITHVATKLGEGLEHKLLPGPIRQVGPPVVSSRHPFAPAQIGPPTPQLPYMYQPAPTYYTGGGGSLSYPESQPVSPYGGSPWGYSTPQATYSQEFSPTYSAAPATQDRPPWEDLALTALPFLL